MRRVTQLSSTPEVRVARLAPSPVGSSLGHCARSWVLYKHIDKYQKGEGKGGGGEMKGNSGIEERERNVEMKLV